MARKLRLEYEGAGYHVINRGNYRTAIFTQQGARDSFMDCLDRAATKSGWVVHAWCLMSNHYHLAIETPQANLVEGMTWLQATFALRFNRFRKETGHLFQGRYKSLVVQPRKGTGALSHYIHLNAVRAGIVGAPELATYPQSSVRWLCHPRERRAWYSPADSLAHAGNLADTPAGRRRYLQYLDWLATDESAQKELKFKEMSKGWAIGTKQFKAELHQNHSALRGALKRGNKDLGDWREAQHREGLDKLIHHLGKTTENIENDPKGTRWKVAIAAEMKRRTNASNPWLAQHLNMGSPFRLSRLATSFESSDGRDGEAIKLKRFCAMCKV